MKNVIQLFKKLTENIKNKFCILNIHSECLKYFYFVKCIFIAYHFETVQLKKF